MRPVPFVPVHEYSACQITVLPAGMDKFRAEAAAPAPVTVTIALAGLSADVMAFSMVDTMVYGPAPLTYMPPRIVISAGLLFTLAVCKPVTVVLVFVTST